MMYPRTDLAIEAREMYSGEKNYIKDPDGITSFVEEKDDAIITTVEIENQSGALKLNKPIGKYITVESQALKSLDPDRTNKLSYLIKEQLLKIISLDKNETVLVAGLGNREITPDALGPKVVSDIMVTKHLKKYIPEYIDRDLSSVCAISPGVMGITGIETGDIISGIVKEVNPSLIIAVDALASRNPKRISTTIQITDTGINPGSGVGNKREGLNYETLGVPVIAVGVPTVVDAVSIAFNMMDEICDIIDISESEALKFRQKNQDAIISKLVDNENTNLMVTPKEIDNIISHISKVISNGINLALHPDIGLEYIESFTF